MAKITVQNTEITIIAVNGDDYISLTDLARHKSDEPNAVIANWLRNRNTIEYLGIWEQLYNPDFKPTEFEGFRRQAGLNAFTLSPKKWTEATNAIGIIAKSGRYGGTYAHKDIALKFASWISVEYVVESAHRAINGNVKPNVRAIAIGYSHNHLTLKCYLDSTPTEQDRETLSDIAGEIASDFPPAQIPAITEFCEFSNEPISKLEKFDTFIYVRTDKKCEQF